MNNYPRLNNLRKKDADRVVSMAAANDQNNSSIATNPLAIKKIKRKHGQKNVARVLVLVAALLVVGLTIFGARLLTNGSIFGKSGQANFFGQLKSIFGDGQPLIGENQDEVNFLLLGIGGGQHDGPNLSDTIVIGSIKPSTKQVSLMSLPRDLFVEIPGFGYSKLNSAFALGEENGYPGGGAALARKTIEPIVGLDLPYYVVADFDGFKKIVNDLGGLDIEVHRDFYDNLNRINYEKGMHHFDGEQALYFVRARYANGPEGNDFARAGRTQQALLALRDKALKLNMVSDIGKVTGLIKSLGDHVRTNLTPGEMRRVYSLTNGLNLSQIQTKVIDDAKTGLLYSGRQTMGGVSVFVLMPNDSSFSEIQSFVSKRFEAEPPEPEDASVEIQNGSDTVGIAGSFSNNFSLNLRVTGVANASQSDYQTTFIVDNTGGEVPIALELIKQYLKDKGLDGVSVISNSVYENTSPADIIIVLGQDNNQL